MDDRIDRNHPVDRVAVFVESSINAPIEMMKYVTRVSFCVGYPICIENPVQQMRCPGLSPFDRWRGRARTTLLGLACVVSGCVQSQRATDVGDPGFPFGPSAIGPQPLAYVQDIKPLFDRDCLSCHSSRDARGSYSVSTYAEVMGDQRPGDATSSVVVDCAPGGSMYRYFSGDAETKATEVFRWMVYYNAAQTR
jgi:hypothetical protein